MRNLRSVAVLFAAVVACGSVQAMGSGTTKIDFQLVAGDAASSRLFIKRDVSATTGQLPLVGSKSVNDNMAGQTVTLYIGSAAFSGTATDKGKVETPFAAKLTGNGKGLQVKASGLNLEELFPIDKTDGNHSVTVQIKVTCASTDPATQAVTTITLTDAAVVFEYTAKKGKVKGRGF